LRFSWIEAVSFKTLEARLPSRVVTLLRITVSAYLVLGALLFSYLVYHALTSPLEFKRSGYEMYERDPQLFLALVVLGLLVVPAMFVGLILELARASRRMRVYMPACWILLSGDVRY